MKAQLISGHTQESCCWVHSFKEWRQTLS